jgi:hypothetical protein
MLYSKPMLATIRETLEELLQVTGQKAQISPGLA